MSSLEEQALRTAALGFARAQIQPLEVKMRVDRAARVAHLLREQNPLTDRVVFERSELDDALELARLTLLHAGAAHLIALPGAPLPPSQTDALLLQVREVIRSAQRRFSTNGAAVNAALTGFGELIALLSPCSRMPGDPECPRDGECPEHGRHRPGQCEPEGSWEAQSCQHPAEDLYIHVGLPATHSAFPCPRCRRTLSIHSSRLTDRVPADPERK